MFLQGLSDYINANAPMTNLPELLGLHHSNPLGLHPIVIPVVLQVLAVALQVISLQIHYKKRPLYPLLYALLIFATVCTYYYCFSDDLPQFEDLQLGRKEACVGWFCQRSIVGLGWSLLGTVLLTYIVYCFLSSMMQMVEYVNNYRGMADKNWMEWQYVIFFMLLGASVAGVADEFAPIAGVWIMIAYQVLMLLVIVVKLIADIVRSHKVGRCLFAAFSFFVVIEAVTMLAIECIEGYIYIFIPVVVIISMASTRYKKKQVK